MSYFDKLETIRDRHTFTLDQPVFGRPSGVRCRGCGREFTYFKSQFDTNNNKVGLRVSHPRKYLGSVIFDSGDI